MLICSDSAFNSNGDRKEVTINGNTKCLAEWCIIYHISPSAVWLRTQKGIDIVTAITTPSRTRSKRYDGCVDTECGTYQAMKIIEYLKEVG